MESKFFLRSRQVLAAAISFIPTVLTVLCSVGVWCAQSGVAEAITGLGTSVLGLLVGGLALYGRLVQGGVSWAALAVAVTAAAGQSISQLTNTSIDPALQEGVAGFSGAVVSAISAALVLWSKRKPDNAALTPLPARAVASAP